MAEAEFDTRRINAEKIWEELKRRREAKIDQPDKPSRKKRRSGKESKRIQALSEVLSANEETETPEKPSEEVSSEGNLVEDDNRPGKRPNLFEQAKDFYEKADKMAASQALLLNKELEDRGIIEKITDETGLKVIGKEAASKEKNNNQNKSE